MKKLLFKEGQKFNQWWLWVILVGAFAVSVVPLWYGLLSQLTTGEPWGDNPASDVILAVTTGAITLLMGGVVILFFASRLNTEITEDAISFRFRPFYRSGKVIHRDEIASFKVGTYNPILEYGGWGIRQGWQKKKVAYNVSGKEGLTLTLKNGKSILIGTRRVQATTAAMEKMMRGKDI